jgi:sulfate-transporting ATPase
MIVGVDYPSERGQNASGGEDRVATASDAALQVRDLSVRFGGVHAVDGVNLSIERGTICGLIGPNGAGKTTTIDAISGFVRLYRGSLELNGQPIAKWPGHRRARAGMSRTFQQLELFEDLSVEENVAVAGRAARRSTNGDSVDAALEAAGVSAWRASPPRSLSHGQRRLVSLARALACSPSVLLLDEPAAGLDSAETEALATRLRTIVDDLHIAVLLVDHDMSLVLNVCDWVEVIDFGRPLASGPPRVIASDGRVLEAYLGAE